MKRLTVENLGQIKHADVKFGDLTILVGPQATGKSIFLQLAKLAIDSKLIRSEFERFNIGWRDTAGFMNLYFGDGMAAIYDEKKSAVKVDGKDTGIEGLLRKQGARKGKGGEEMFFVPAQRVLSLREGSTRPFTDYRSGDPFVVREFSEKLHQLLQREFHSSSDMFPRKNLLKQEVRELLDKHIFGGFELKIDATRPDKRMVLQGPAASETLPYLVWSAGQREFVPLLLGFYWLMPPSKVARRDQLEWVVIEELEMGLHPNAIMALMALVLELLQRGYKVCLSTHSTQVLDVAWALQVFKAKGGTHLDVLKILQLPSKPNTKGIADAALRAEVKVYYFQRSGQVKDISCLDPGSEDAAESGWGGLSEFAGNVGDVVSRVVSKAWSKEK